MKEQVITTVKNSRVAFDDVLKAIDALKRRNETKNFGTGRELSMAYTELQIGRMWLGEVLHDLGTEYPYKGTNEAKKPEDIAPAADVSIKDADFYADDNNNYIDLIGGLRTRIDNLYQDIERMVLNYQYNRINENKGIVNFIRNYNETVHMNNVTTHIKNSRMCLGLAMGIIRDYSMQHPVLPKDAYKG